MGNLFGAASQNNWRPNRIIIHRIAAAAIAISHATICNINRNGTQRQMDLMRFVFIGLAKNPFGLIPLILNTVNHLRIGSVPPTNRLLVSIINDMSARAVDHVRIWLTGMNAAYLSKPLPYCITSTRHTFMQWLEKDLSDVGHYALCGFVRLAGN